MEKLYYKDQYIREFDANINNIQEKDNKIYVELDRTAFFPGGGGQHCDLGYIGDSKVLDVVEDGDRIYHIVDKKPASEEKVYCVLDWNRRLDGMQQHLGQHVLSGCFFSLFNKNTAGIHLGKDISTVDIVGEVTEEEIKKAEVRANEVIKEAHRVKFIVTNRAEAKKMGLRRQLQTKDNTIRVVEIEGLDINACCGVHPSNTLELQVIKIKSIEKHKGNSRISFLAGNRAVNDYLYRDRILENLCKTLSAGDVEIEKTINNLNDELRELRDENNSLKSTLSSYQLKELIDNAKEVSGSKIIVKEFKNENSRYLNRLLNSLVSNDNTIVLFANNQIDKANLLFGCSNNLKQVNMSDILKDSIQLIDGKGGGSKVLAQGGGKNVMNISSALDYAVRKIKGLL